MDTPQIVIVITQILTSTGIIVFIGSLIKSLKVTNNAMKNSVAVMEKSQKTTEGAMESVAKSYNAMEKLQEKTLNLMQTYESAFGSSVDVFKKHIEFQKTIADEELQRTKDELEKRGEQSKIDKSENEQLRRRTENLEAYIEELTNIDSGIAHYINAYNNLDTDIFPKYRKGGRIPYLRLADGHAIDIFSVNPPASWLTAFDYQKPSDLSDDRRGSTKESLNDTKEEGPPKTQN